MNATESRREVIQRTWVAAWDAGNVDQLDILLDPCYRRIGGNGRTQSREEFKENILATRAAFPDLITTIDDVVIEGDRAAIRWKSSGTHAAPFLGVPSTHRSVEVSGATFARFEGEQIVEEYVTWDPQSLLVALGVIAVGQD